MAFVQVAMGIIRQPQNTGEWKLMKDYQLKVNKGSGRAIIALTRKVELYSQGNLNKAVPYLPELADESSFWCSCSIISKRC